MEVRRFYCDFLVDDETRCDAPASWEISYAGEYQHGCDDHLAPLTTRYAKRGSTTVKYAERVGRVPEDLTVRTGASAGARANVALDLSRDPTETLH